MKNFKRIFSFLFIFAVLVVLASCGSTSGVKGVLKASSTLTTISVSAEFDENAKLKDGSAAPHIQLWKDDEYQSKDFALTFTDKLCVETEEVKFTSLTAGEEYTLKLFVTYNGKDEEVKSAEINVTTIAAGDSWDNAIEIATADDFKDLITGGTEKYYKLTADIDFEGETLSASFTESKKLLAHIDGQNHTISNYKLKSASYIGLFGYVGSNSENVSEIKNLNIVLDPETTEGDFSSGRSTARIGALAGYMENCIVSNVHIKNPKFIINANSSAELYVGGVVGQGKYVTFDDVTVENVNIKFQKSRLTVCAGLFAGQLSGDVASKLNENKVLANKCSAEGQINAHLYYVGNSSDSMAFTYIGGFLGNSGSPAKISECYAISDILVTKESNGTANRDFELAIGGFIGANTVGQLNVIDCLAMSDITVYAGAVVDKVVAEEVTSGDDPVESTSEPVESTNPESTSGTITDGEGGETPADEPEKEKTEYEIECESSLGARGTYIGGFIGYAKPFIINVENCVYTKKAAGMKLVCGYKYTVDDKEYTVYASLTVARNTDTKDVDVKAYDVESMDLPDGFIPWSSPIASTIDKRFETIIEAYRTSQHV